MEAFRERLRTSSDVAWLEQIAASEAFLRSEWRKTVVRVQWNKVHRSTAYARLGELGTAESLAAVHRVEAGLRGTRLLPDVVEPGSTWITPTPGMGDRTLVPAHPLVIDGREYAVEILESYGPFAPYVMSRAVGRTSWTRPILAGPPGPGAWSFETSLSPGPGGFTVEFRPRPGVTPVVSPSPIAINLDDLTRDADGDGWTDFEERQLGLDPARADSDGDGADDGHDVCPLYAAPPDEATDEDAQILQRALLVTYGLTGSRWALFVRPGVRPVQLYGHSGPVIFGVDLPTRDGPRSEPVGGRGGAQSTWRIAERTAREAIVETTDWSGSSFKSTSRVTLRRINAEWVVVGSALVGMR